MVTGPGRLVLLGCALCGALAVALPARAGGLPASGPGAAQATAADGSRYVAIRAGTGTFVERLAADGHLLGSTLLAGRFTVPVVADDGSTSGLSHDGRTLALVSPRRSLRQRQTRLATLEARGLRVRGIVTLAGNFSLDAISPNGARLYLIQYLSSQDASFYRVRAFDVAAGRLLPKPVIDPRERGEKMRGVPISRATSADGRWAYTLYAAAEGPPFVHALDTSRSRARCVDLDALGGRRQLARLRLRLDDHDRTLIVADGRARPASVDTRTFAVSTGDEGGAEGGYGGWWTLPVVAAVLVAAAAAASLVRRRKRLVQA